MEKSRQRNRIINNILEIIENSDIEICQLNFKTLYKR